MPVTVEGVLDSPPGGASKGKGWALIFHLMPWQRVLDRGKPLPEKPLRIEIPMTERALQAWMTKIDTGSSVRVVVDRVRLFNKRALWWFGIAKTGPRKVKLPEGLAKAVAGRAKKVSIRDAVLGKLVLDRSLEAFVGRATLFGFKVRLLVTQSSTEDDRQRDARDVERAASTMGKLERSRRAIEKMIVKKMLPLYNDNWRDTRPAISWVQLLARIRPTSVTLHSDGSASIYYKDGGLFLGHWIDVRIRRSGSVSEVTLAG